MGYVQTRALRPVLILEKLSSAGETQVGRPENGCRGCVVSGFCCVSQNRDLYSVVMLAKGTTGLF